MIREATSKDIPKLNKILNHPEVIEGAAIGMDGPLDIRAAFASDCVVLVDNFGGVVFSPSSENEYEGHFFFLPEGRGRHAIEASKEALNIIFAKGAEKIVAAIPKSYKSSRLMARWVGLTSTGIGPSDYGGEIHESEFFEVTKCL